MSVEDLIALVVTADADGLKEGLNNGLKAFVNTPNPDGFFPLHIAVKARHAHIAQILLEAGASPSVASEEAGSHKGYTPIHFAASEGDVDLMKLLFKHKAEVNVPAADGWFPLHIASFKGKRVAMELLVDQGAIVDCENSHSFTPLTFAVSHGRLGDVRFLIERGASTTVTDKKGDSLLHHCFQYQVAKMFEGDYDVPEAQLDVAVALVLNGADHTRTNIDGCEATFYYKDDIPSLDEALQLMHDYRAIFTTSSKEWNYMSFVSASTLNFISLGLPPAAAEKFVPIMASVDKERLESKALRLEEQANSGGCPVMRSRKKPKDQPAAPTDGSDPSGGKCPFFQNKTNAADGTVPAGHPPVNAEQMRAAGADPSGGKCPFFQKKGETVMALDDPNRPLCPFSRAFARRHQRTLLLMSISFVFGVLCSQLFLQK